MKQMNSDIHPTDVHPMDHYQLARPRLLCSTHESQGHSPDKVNESYLEPKTLEIHTNNPSRLSNHSDSDTFDPVVSVVDEIDSGVIYARDAVQTDNKKNKKAASRGISNIDFNI